MASIDDKLNRHQDARDTAAREATEWHWRLLLAIGVANGTGLITVGSMVGAAGFSDRALRALIWPGAAFILGMFLYGFGVFANWSVARLTVQQHNENALGVAEGYMRIQGTSEPVPIPGGGRKKLVRAKRAEGFSLCAVLSRTVAWITIGLAASSWIAGAIALGNAVYSGSLRRAEVAPKPTIINVNVPPPVVIRQVAPEPAGALREEGRKAVSDQSKKSRTGTHKVVAAPPSA